MKKLIIYLSIIVIFASCTWQKPPSVCDNIYQPSALCDISAQYNLRLETMGDLLMVVNLRAINMGAYSANEAVIVLNTIKILAEQKITVAMLQKYVLGYAQEYPELILVLPYISYLNVDTWLTDADVEMISYWVDQQMLWLE